MIITTFDQIYLDTSQYNKVTMQVLPPFYCYFFLKHCLLCINLTLFFQVTGGSFSNVFSHRHFMELLPIWLIKQRKALSLTIQKGVNA